MSMVQLQNEMKNAHKHLTHGNVPFTSMTHQTGNTVDAAQMRKDCDCEKSSNIKNTIAKKQASNVKKNGESIIASSIFKRQCNYSDSQDKRFITL